MGLLASLAPVVIAFAVLADHRPERTFWDWTSLVVVVLVAFWAAARIWHPADRTRTTEFAIGGLALSSAIVYIIYQGFTAHPWSLLAVCATLLTFGALVLVAHAIEMAEPRHL